ncbi:MAG: 16S rRNA (cytosine(967)-C(5))-methyltransferase RsmB [Candidatus Coatesbacteria bacterium]|nr:16S rRNA (cytosine(967)-C(5))-methyltransferase RsmB [Candidatus Coatesbacteria bacterium]
MTSARTIAFEVLTSVQTQGAYADVLLSALLARNPDLSPAEKRLATELVFGILRNQTLLDHYLAQAGSFRPERTSASTAAALRLGAYQIMFLHNVPDFAAVNETVQIAKRLCGDKASGFVNALLRQLIRRKTSLEPPQLALDADDAEFISSLALVFSFPEQLIARWGSRLGRKELVQLVAALNQAPPKTIRVNVTKTTPGDLAVKLRQRGLEATESLFCPSALRLLGQGSPEDTPEWREGLFTIQDEGAQLVCLLLEGLEPKSIVDVCAGVGQKLTHLAELFPKVLVLGGDIHPRKVKDARRQADRLGLKNVRLFASDLLSSALRRGAFDLLLLDAPCSGTGTIRRHPEIRWRIRPAQLAQLARLQLRMLESCARLVRPGGTMLYSTCSLEPEENQNVITKFLKRNAGFRAQSPRQLPDLLRASEDPLGVTILPHVLDCDGMFFSLLVRP